MSKPRVFVYNGQEYEDPNPALTNEQVRDLLARTFGALANGQVEERDEADRLVVEFKPRAQRKGSEQPIYTFGYEGKTVADLVAHQSRTGAMVVDTRYSPKSANPAWRKAALQNALPDGGYVHLPALGNVNYKNPRGQIQIADMETGISLLRVVLQRVPVILLCVCPNPATCHRQVVAQELVDHGLGTVIVHLE